MFSYSFYFAGKIISHQLACNPDPIYITCSTVGCFDGSNSYTINEDTIIISIISIVMNAKRTMTMRCFLVILIKLEEPYVHKPHNDCLFL